MVLPIIKPTSPSVIFIQYIKLASEVRSLLSYNRGDSSLVVEESYSCLLCFISFTLNVYSFPNSYWKSTAICSYVNIAIIVFYL